MPVVVVYEVASDVAAFVAVLPVTISEAAPSTSELDVVIMAGLVSMLLLRY